MGEGDLVEPSASTPVTAGYFNVNIYRSRPVMVVDGMNQKSILTAFQSPRLIAEAAGFKMYPEDTYEMVVDQDIASDSLVGQKVTIHRAVPVLIRADGQQITVRTQAKTVGAALDERDVALGPQDTAVPARDTVISPNMEIQINRVKIAIITTSDAIAHDTQTIKDPNVVAGTTQVRTAGVDGAKQTVYRVHYTNGVEQGRETVSQTVTTQPVTAVVVIGTKIDYSADPVGLGKQMAAARGWTGDEWLSLYQLWQHESGWNPASRNFFSGACGIPQAYPCSKISDHSTAGQISWGLSYIAGKYGSPSNAWAYWQRNNSY